MIGNVLLSIAALCVVLGVLVFIHELGHYMACKAFGVWVHRFSIGIGKPIPGLRFFRGETEWAVAWLPIGGYVKMASREEDASSILEGDAPSTPVPPDRVFEAKPVWQRMVIILAGVGVNTIFALLVFVGLAWKNGRHYDPTTTIGAVSTQVLPPQAKALASVPPGTRITAVDGKPVHSWDDITDHITEGAHDEITLQFDSGKPVVIPMHRDALSQRVALATALEPVQPAVLSVVEPGDPAAKGGLEAGDSIIAVNGTPVLQWSDLLKIVQPSAGKTLDFVVIRDGAERHATVIPKQAHAVPADAHSPMVGWIGVAAEVPVVTEHLDLPGAVGAGVDATVSSAGTIYRTMRGMADGHVSTKEVGGPILIAQMGAQEAREGFQAFLAFMALISINLAVINLLPVPVLDGGGFFLLLIEVVLRRPAPLKLREGLSLVGLTIVALLMVVAFKNDIMRMFGH